MDKAYLRRQAARIARISERHRPDIEDYTGDADSGGGRALFVWTDTLTGAKIHLTLQGDGRLISWSQEDVSPPGRELPTASLQERAEQFMAEHIPHPVPDFSLTKTSRGERSVRFEYTETCAGLPLPMTGWFAVVGFSGEILQFRYYGHAADRPQPPKVVPKETLLPRVAEVLRLRLAVAALNPELLDVKRMELRLVYVTGDHVHAIHAETGQCKISRSDEDAESSSDYHDVPEVDDPATLHHTAEEIIGVASGGFVRLREVDMGETVGVVWGVRERNRNMQDLSVLGYFKQRSEQTVKAILNKRDGRVLSFMSFMDTRGPHEFNRRQCFSIALRFLKQVFPDYANYLQVKAAEDDAAARGSREHFQFRVRIGKIPVYLQWLTVVVDRTMGIVVNYSGLDFDPVLLSDVPVTPKIEPEQAAEIYSDMLDLELKWERTRNAAARAYQLIYKPVHRDNRQEIRCIDAVTGELICAKEQP